MGRPLGRFRQGSAGAGPGQDHRRVLRAPDCGPGPGRQGGEERERGVGSQRVPGRTDGDGQGAVWRQGLPRESHPPTYLPYLLPLFLSHPLFLTRNFIDDGKKKKRCPYFNLRTNKQTNKQTRHPKPTNHPRTPQQSIYQMHRDHVYPPLPPSSPPVHLLGSSPACAIQGMYRPRAFITVQGHPEFTPDVVTELLETRMEQGVFGAGIFEEGMGRVGGANDGVVVAGVWLRFLSG